MKAIKFVVKFVLWTLAIVLLAVLALPLWFGPVVKFVANASVPGVTKTDFRLERIALNPYTGRFELESMKLGNPKGCSGKDAFSVGTVNFDLGMTTLPTDTIHVEEIVVKDVFVSIESTDEGVGNFKQIQYNVAGGREKCEAAEAENAQLKAEKQAAPEAEPEEPKDDTGTEKKFVIDHLEISGITIKLGMLPITIPVAITLNDIGKKSGGATLEEVWAEVLAAVMKAAGVMGDQLKALGGVASDAAMQAADAATAAATQATETATKAVGDVSEAATKAVGDVSSAAAGVVGDAAGATTKAVGDAAGTATKAVGDAVGGAADAVGDGAKKAMDSLKSLW